MADSCNNREYCANMDKLKVDIVTLGCSKNLVDSERLMQQFADHNITIRHNPEDDTTVSPIIIINTCGFIGDAKEESINTILQYAALKSEGKVDKIIVMGCLSERYRKELPEANGTVHDFSAPEHQPGTAQQ